jgi:hypothetical protein
VNVGGGRHRRLLDLSANTPVRRRWRLSSTSFGSCGPCARRSSGSTIMRLSFRSTSSSRVGGRWSGSCRRSPSCPMSCAIPSSPVPTIYGQHPTETVLVEGRLRKRQRWMRPPEECRVFLRDHHEGYIDWETYQEDQRMKRGHSLDLQSDPGALTTNVDAITKQMSRFMTWFLGGCQVRRRSLRSPRATVTGQLL